MHFLILLWNRMYFGLKNIQMHVKMLLLEWDVGEHGECDKLSFPKFIRFWQHAAEDRRKAN